MIETILLVEVTAGSKIAVSCLVSETLIFHHALDSRDCGVAVRKFVSHLVDLGLIPSSNHTKHFRNGVPSLPA